MLTNIKARSIQSPVRINTQLKPFSKILEFARPKPDHRWEHKFSKFSEIICVSYIV